jgi:ketosteroid isomerase-like protein
MTAAREEGKVAMSGGGLEARLRRIEDKADIEDLVVLYGFVMDERDLDGVRRLFADDATLRSHDGVFAAAGMDQILRTYQGRFDALGPTNHVSHGHVVRFDDGDPDIARGLVAGHAEVVRNDEAMLVGLRYRDVYRRTQDGWRFQDRLMSYMYYVSVRDYAEALKGPLSVRAYGDERPAHWPEALYGPSVPAWLGDFLR